MADVTLAALTVGDSADLPFTVTDGATPIDLSKAVDGTADRPAIVRFAIEDIAQKASYSSEEVVVLDQTSDTGKVRVLIDKPDTEDAEPGTHRWDLEVTRQDVIRTSAGVISVEENTTIVTGIGVDFTKGRVGDVLQPLGSLNTKPVKILSIAGANEMEVESGIVFSADETGIPFEIRRGKSKTYPTAPDKGKIPLKDGVVAK